MKKHKSLYRNSKKINYLMQKRGLLEVGAVALIIITTIGVLIVISESKHIIVGDTKTKFLYDFSKCSEEVNKIPTNNQIVFEDKQQAYSLNYKDKEGCI